MIFQDTVKFFALKYVLGCLISVLCGVVGVVCVLTRSFLTVTVTKKGVHIFELYKYQSKVVKSLIHFSIYIFHTAKPKAKAKATPKATPKAKAKSKKENTSPTAVSELGKKSTPKRPKVQKKTRPSPTDSATKYAEGTLMQGNDGNMYIIGVDKNGVHKWKKA